MILSIIREEVVYSASSASLSVFVDSTGYTENFNFNMKNK